ncbi:MAG: hypothetical protein ACRD4C_00765 [Candidatus Acidiferrales bacterium]
MRFAASIAKWMAIGMAALLALIYIGDYLSVRYRMAHNVANRPLEVLKFRPIYAIPHKDGKSEFDFGDTETETCVQSLFPQFGYRPCWYAHRANQKPIVLDGR